MKTIKLTGFQAELIISALMDSACDNVRKGCLYTPREEAELCELVFPAIREENVKIYREALDNTKELINSAIERREEKQTAGVNENE